MSKPDIFDDTQAKKLLTRSLKILDNQISIFEHMDKLDPHELRALNDIVKTLVSVDRNERQSDLEDDLTKVSDEDLEELAKKVVDKTKGK